MSGQEIAKPPTPTPMMEVCTTIAGDEFGAKIAQALPGNVTLDRFRRVTLTAIQQNPEVITANRQSLYNSVIRCAQDGLLPDGREAALVIYKVKGEARVQYLPMIGGYRKIAAKHGITLAADVVRANDRFEWSKVPPKIEHSYSLGDERGEPIGAYAIAFYSADGRIVGPPTVMSVAEIEQVRAVSRAATSEYGPWVKWWDRMACKTVARRQWGELPLGDLDEADAATIAQADVDADLPALGSGMTEEEANLSVTASASGAIPDDGGPDDTVEAEATEADEPEPEPDAEAEQIQFGDDEPDPPATRRRTRAGA